MDQIREHWSTRLGFLMATLGSAIGLGILWKFPYIVGVNGGGLFLFSYLICLFVVGIPIFIAELILGRSTQRAAVGAYEVLDEKRKGWKVIGWFGVIASFLIMSYYSVIAGWGMSYILMSINGAYQHLSGQEISLAFTALAESGGVTLLWHFFFTLITVIIVMGGVRKGIEKWATIMMKMLLVLLLLLFFYTLTLQGFPQSARFVFQPNFGNFKLSSVIEALGLAFWTMSIGQGIMISYGSYMKRTESIVKMSGVVAGSVIIVAILSALVIFPVVFSFGLPPQAGPGLIFKTLPFLFAKLPAPLLLSITFFTLFVFTALTSAIPLIEVVATNIMELYRMSRKKAVFWVGVGTFFFGIPSAFAYTGKFFPDWKEVYGVDFLQTIDNLVSIWIIPIGGFFSAIFVGWIMNKKVAEAEFLYGMKWRFFWRPWRFFVRWLVPLMILLIIIQKSGLFNFDLLLSGRSGG